MSFLNRSFISQRGISLMELALILPLLLVFITGIIDYGLGIRAVNRLATAASTGARYAVSQSSDGVACSSAGVEEAPCADILSNSFGPSITYFAKYSACQSLNDEGLAGDGWQVLVSVDDAPNATLIKPSLVQADQKAQTVKVTAQRDPDTGRFCLVCLDKIAANFQIGELKSSVIKSVSTFALNRECT